MLLLQTSGLAGFQGRTPNLLPPTQNLERRGTEPTILTTQKSSPPNQQSSHTTLCSRGRLFESCHCDIYPSNPRWETIGSYLAFSLASSLVSIAPIQSIGDSGWRFGVIIEVFSCLLCLSSTRCVPYGCRMRHVQLAETCEANSQFFCIAWFSIWSVYFVAKSIRKTVHHQQQRHVCGGASKHSPRNFQERVRTNTAETIWFGYSG